MPLNVTEVRQRMFGRPPGASIASRGNNWGNEQRIVLTKASIHAAWQAVFELLRGPNQRITAAPGLKAVRCP